MKKNILIFLLLQTSLSMVGVFLIAWTPYTVVSIYSIWSDSLSTWMLLLPTLLAKSCTLLNPTVCALMSSKFRKAARRMFCKNKRIHPTVAVFAVPEIRNSTTSSCLRYSMILRYIIEHTNDNHRSVTELKNLHLIFIQDF